MTARLPPPPRARPGWATPPWLTRTGAGLVAIGALVCAGLAWQEVGMRRVADAPAAGTATVTGADTVIGRHGHRSGRMLFKVGADADSCTTYVADAAAFTAGHTTEEQPFWIGGALVRKRLLGVCAAFEDARALPLAIVFGALALGLGAWAAGILVVGGRGDRLLTDGTAVMGRVVEVKLRGERPPQIVLRYVFAAPEEIAGREVVSRRVWREMGNAEPPAAGEKIRIVHDPERPGRNRVWGPVDA